MSRPEHALQVRINAFVREYVPQPHFFFAVDRSQAGGRFTHAREKARGLVAGIPDTMLLYPHLPVIAVELKAPGNQPSDVQQLVKDKIIAAGHVWCWTSSVRGYAGILGDHGVVLRDGWRFAAERADAVLDGVASKREKTKPAQRNRQPKAAAYAMPPLLEEVFPDMALPS